MKKLLCVALMLLMGVVPAVAEASEESVPIEHLLWDIPFGIGVDECIALVQESVGAELDVDMWGLDRGPSAFISSSNHEFTIWGVPGKLIVDFDKNELLRAIFAEGSEDVPIEEWEEEWETFRGKRIRNLMEMLEKAERKYGETIGGIITISIRDPEKKRSRKEEKYLLPLINGRPDINTLSDVFAEDANSLVVSCYYRGGVSVGIALSRISYFDDEYTYYLESGVGLYSEEGIHYELYESGLHEYPTRGDGPETESGE